MDFFSLRCYFSPLVQHSTQALTPKPWIYVEAFAREHKQDIKKDPAFRRHFQAAAQFSLQYLLARSPTFIVTVFRKAYRRDPQLEKSFIFFGRVY